MRIVNRKEFLELPIGTLFSKYEPVFFQELCIKDKSRMPEKGFPEDVGDFYYQNVNDPINSAGLESYEKKLDEILKNGTSLKLDFEMDERDGLYDEYQLFAVWERDDVERLISRLKSALETGYGLDNNS